MNKEFAIIEIGSNNTKTHIYENDKVIYEKTTTIEFKANYKIDNKILKTEIEKLNKVIEKALKYTNNIHIYGCKKMKQIIQLLDVIIIWNMMEMFVFL